MTRRKYLDERAELEKTRAGPRPSRTCVYCGRLGATAEHVFPRNLFLAPRPSNLITVPACAPCNQAFSKDDEYFLVVIGSVSYSSSVGKRVWKEKVLPTLNRTRALKGSLLSTLKQIDVRTPGGIHLGKAHAIGFSTRRMARILAKITNGLLWYHAQVGLRDDTVVGFYEVEDVKVLSPFLPHLKSNAIGDGSVVSYRYGIAAEDPQGTMWVIRFYATKVFQIITLPSGSKSLPEHGKTYKELITPLSRLSV
jgi:hypothetical protein